MLVFLLLFVSVEGSLRIDPLVETTQGLVKGLKADDGSYSMFLGIPYGRVDAASPFGASYPHPKFDGIFEAYDDSATCPQADYITNELSGTIDCLNLNIYVPNKASSRNKLPVLVWIYGGGYEFGSANKELYGPNFLVKHDVIIVSLNYRVGPYGFFCLNIPEVPGNQGIKDQVLALRWIKNNIESFGGNVNKITVMGESAGSASIEYHLYSDVEPLFHQAILESGTLLSPTFIQDSDPTRPIKIAERLGFFTEDIYKALSFLANTDSNLVIVASRDLGIEYRPCVEKAFENVESIITDHPLNLDVPKVKKIPVLAGFNSHEEMADFVNKPEEYYTNLNIINSHLKYAFEYDEDFVKMEDYVRHFYLGDEEESAETIHSLNDFQTDYKFSYPIQKSLKKYVDNGATQVYQYMFSYSGGLNLVKKNLNISDEGALHADELGYLFGGSLDSDAVSEEDQRMIDQMTTLWTNFVKYGEPTPATSELLPEKWVPITKDTINYLHIGKELKMSKRPYHDRIVFWELFYKINEDRLKAHRQG